MTGRTRLPGFAGEWRDVKLGDIVRFSKGSGLSKSDLTPGGSESCIHYGELFTYYGAEIESVTSRTNLTGRLVRSEALDVLMPTSDVTPRGLAKASAIRESDVILGGDILIIRPDPCEAYGPFIAQAIRRDETQVLQLVRGSTVFHLYASDMKNFRLRLPHVREQRAVAQVLRDADDFIFSLERLIAKKRAIKQGLMQELLTGRTRLPGFNEEWGNARLGSALKVRNGRSQRDIEVPTGRYPILATGGEIGRTDSPIYSKPSVLIGRKGTIDRPQFREEPFWTVDTLFYTEIDPRADARFLYYLCTTIDWMSLSEATGVPSLTATRIESVEVVLPNRQEQQAIATLIRAADDELRALERRLESTRAIKQGMMQELLTGRTRLPVGEEVSV